MTDDNELVTLETMALALAQGGGDKIREFLDSPSGEGKLTCEQALEAHCSQKCTQGALEILRAQQKKKSGFRPAHVGRENTDIEQTRAALEAAGLGARVPTIEILWDNFCAQDPVRLADDLSVLADRVMLHVMWSRYLEVDERSFAYYLARLAQHVRALRPVAISDHLCRFRFDGAFVGAGQEYTYDRVEHVASRIARYQEAIGQQLLLENNASLEQPADVQLAFVHELMERTRCGIAFRCLQRRDRRASGRGSVATGWPHLAGRRLRCHVVSYVRRGGRPLRQPRRRRRSRDTGCAFDRAEARRRDITYERLRSDRRVAGVTWCGSPHACDWEAKVRAMSLDHLCMSTACRDVPSHLLQSPFVLAPDDDSWRARRAPAALWLINHDLRPFNRLIIAHVERP